MAMELADEQATPEELSAAKAAHAAAESQLATARAAQEAAESQLVAAAEEKDDTGVSDRLVEIGCGIQAGIYCRAHLAL